MFTGHTVAVDVLVNFDDLESASSLEVLVWSLKSLKSLKYHIVIYCNDMYSIVITKIFNREKRLSTEEIKLEDIDFECIQEG